MFCYCRFIDHGKRLSIIVKHTQIKHVILMHFPPLFFFFFLFLFFFPLLMTIQKINRFPSEFLQKVSTHLTFQDCYNCIFVCKFWHHTFQRALYKKIDIYTDTQFDQLLNSLKYHGSLVKEIRLNSAIPHEVTAYIEEEEQQGGGYHVQLTQDKFELLNQYCPSLEVIDFHISQWNHISLESVKKWKQMRHCVVPILYSTQYNSFLSVFGSSNLTVLHVQHYLQDLEFLVDKLGFAPAIQELTLEILFTSNNSEEDMTMPLSKHLQKMHSNLPRLKKFNFIRSKTPNHEPPASSHDQHFLSPFVQPCTSLESLSLHGHVNSIKWFEFIYINYPNLTTLSLTQLTTSRFGTKWMWQHALVQLIQSLPLLKTLTLGGRNVPQLISKSLAKELKVCSIENLYVDFETYQAIESCQFLLVVASYGLDQLKYLRLRVWEQIPGWSGVTSNLFQCKQLTTLELSLSKGLMDQFPYTSFLIDYFLVNLPQLENLSLTGAHVQVTYNNFVDLDVGSFALKKLELFQSKVENHQVVFQYLSSCCPQLNQVLFRKCVTEKKKSNFPLLNAFVLDLGQSELDKIVLSTLLIYVGTIQSNEFVGIQIKCNSNEEQQEKEDTNTIWCSAIKSMGPFIYPTYSLSDDQEKNTELDNVYQSYKSSVQLSNIMPGNYTPTIGFFTIYCRSVKSVFLDNLLVVKR
jgi:hypothetical protein